jgi:hypothetical protein
MKLRFALHQSRPWSRVAPLEAAAAIRILNYELPPRFERGNLTTCAPKHEYDVPPPAPNILPRVALCAFIDRNTLVKGSGRHGYWPLQTGLPRQRTKRLRRHVNQDAVLDCLSPGVPRENFCVIKQ